MNKNQISNILVPTDFSDCAIKAIEATIPIALSHNSSIVLLEVVSPIPELYGLHKDKATKEQQLTLIEQRLNRITKEAADLQLIHGVKIEPKIIVGQTVDSIVKVAEDRSVELIVIGAHGISGFREFLIGSIAYGVTEKATCPVLTVPLSSKTLTFKKVMFPVRNIANALEKYTFLLEFIRKGTTELLVYGIFSDQDSHTQDIENKITNFVQQVRQDGITISSMTKNTDSDLADDVIKTANKMNCDIIIITSKVTTSIKDFFIGKFAQRVINHSNLAVMHVPID
ncbi:nucleotide-binding universal stress UspA family protein [Pedobacter sp. AK017]|uniref:universal stress protein n=1 Tax=Pedobacter sp. AK017 TaxID=2723073 RepID=UPI0016206CF9|nr:universal stress protein [Pedobacter sp. AK017]MBB5438165.1 nucleotide-binding universal stress UspA family protein [Pedobacter sp. AK017]